MGETVNHVPGLICKPCTWTVPQLPLSPSRNQSGASRSTARICSRELAFYSESGLLLSDTQDGREIAVLDPRLGTPHTGRWSRGSERLNELFAPLRSGTTTKKARLFSKSAAGV